MEATTPDDAEIRKTIMTMGADEVAITRENGVIYVSYHRQGGCGRIYVNICNFMKKRFKGQEIVLLESPQINKYCSKARVRKLGSSHFSRTSVLVTASRLGAL